MGYRVTGGFGVPVYYRCSRCNRINKFKHDIRISYTGRNDGKLEAEEAFKVKLNLFRDKIWTDAKQRKYYRAQYDTKCFACGHQEPWSMLRFGGLNLISAIGSFSLLFLGLGIEVTAWYESGDTPTYFLFSITSLLAIIVPKIVKLIMRKKREKEIEQLNYAYHPIICWREEDEEKIIQELTNRAREAGIIK